MKKVRTPEPDDWRRQGQDKYLTAVNLKLREYSPYRPGWDHDHCEFCGVKFSTSEGDLKKGYSSEDFNHWICTECYDDFKEEFNWQTVG